MCKEDRLHTDQKIASSPDGTGQAGGLNVEEYK